MKTKMKLAIFSACLISFLIGASFIYLVKAQTASTYWISEGVYPSTSSYTIWKEGSYYYAKTEYGQLINSGTTNASFLIQTCIDALPRTPTSDQGGGIIHLKQGIYSLDTQITISWHRISITGEGIETTILDTTNAVTDSVIQFNDTTTYGCFWNTLSDFAIDGYSSPTISGIKLNGVSSGTFRNLRIRGFNSGGVGVNFTLNSNNKGCYYNSFYNVYVSWCDTGYLIQGSPTIYQNNNNFNGGWVQHHEDAGVNITNAKGNNFYGVNVENYEGTQGYWFGGNATQNNVFGGWVEDSGAVTGFNFTNVAGCRGNLVYNVRFYLPTGTEWSDSTTNKDNTMIYSDEANGDFRIIPSYIAFDTPTGASWAYVSSYYGAFHIDAGLRVGSYLTLVPMSHPNTGTWGASEEGRIWFCDDHNALEYWDGSAIVTP